MFLHATEFWQALFSEVPNASKIIKHLCFSFFSAPLPNLTSEDIDRALAPSVASSTSYAGMSIRYQCVCLLWFPLKNIALYKVLWKRKKGITIFLSYRIPLIRIYLNKLSPPAVYFNQKVIAVIWVCLCAPIRSQTFVGFSVTRSADTRACCSSFRAVYRLLTIRLSSQVDCQTRITSYDIPLTIFVYTL